MHLKAPTIGLSLSLLLFFVIGCTKKSSVQTAETTSTPATAPTTTPAPTTATASAASSQPSAAPTFDAKKVSVHNLPDSVKPFVAQNYPGYVIAAATYDPLCGGAPAIDVAIRAKGKPAYSVIFLPNGHYVQREQDVPLATIPATVIAAVKAKYAGFKPGRQAEKLVLVDNSTEYSVDLFKPHNQLEAIFSSSGEVVCEGRE